MAMRTKVIGPISAYAIAVANGYTGTEAEFAEQIANAATNAQTAQTAAETVQGLVESLPSDFETTQENFAPLYADLTFPVKNGQHCIYGGIYYEANTDIASSEAWTAAHWTKRNVGAEVSDLKSAIDMGLSGIRSLVDRTPEFVKNYYIKNGAVGDTINPSSEVSWNSTSSKGAYCLFPISKGDIVRFNGSSASGSSNRAMVFTDSNYTIVKAYNAGAFTNVTIEWTAEVDGYCLIDVEYYKSGVYKDYTAYQMKDDTYSALKSNVSSWQEYEKNGYIQIPGNWVQGEFGSFADVAYASKSPWMTLERETLFMVTDPGNYYLTFYVNNNGTLSKNTSYPTWGVYASGKVVRVAVNAYDETESLTPSIARTKVLMSIPISENERLKDTYSAVGVFDQIGIIGDSFAVGSMHWENDGYHGYPNLSWGKLMCKRNGNNCTLYAHGGYGIKRFVEYILPTVLSDDPCNLYWWGLGINDNETARTNASATGTIDDITDHEIDGLYPDTLYGNFGRAVSQIKTHAPLAKHVFASCIKDNVNNRYTSYAAINTVLKTVAEHYGFPFIEITDDPFYWSAFYRDSAWVGHPVLIGYAGMSWANERLLNKCIVDNMTYFRDYGRTNNPEDTDPTGQE